jgi:putative membrane protein
MDERTSRFEVESNASNHFAWLRTRMALERSFMAGVRTAVSLIGFGFTIVQFFQRLQSAAPAGGPAHPQAPRDLGLALILAGIGCLGVFTWQFRRGIEYLWSTPFRPIAGIGHEPGFTPLYIVAWVVLLIGLIAFASVFVRF